MSFSGTVLLGLGLFSDVLNEDAKIRGPALVNVATGKYRNELMAVAFYQYHKRNPAEGEDYLADPHAVAHYERIVAFCKDVIRGIFNSAARDDLDRKRKDFENLRQRLAESNKPHAQGTVAELMAKLGVSKSEVRRLKASGELDAALKAKGFA